MTIATGPLDDVRLLSAEEAERQTTDSIGEVPVEADLSGLRILIADDVEANREFFSLVLQRAGAECYYAGNGQEALDALFTARFDLVLLDMQMPVLDGYSAAREIRVMGLRMPVIAITANGTEDDKSRCHEAGCTDYLTKPITISQLLRGVAEAVGRPFSKSHQPRRLPSLSLLPSLLLRLLLL